MMSKILLSPNSAKFTGPMVCLSMGYFSQFSYHPSRENKAIYNKRPISLK